MPDKETWNKFISSRSEFISIPDYSGETRKFKLEGHLGIGYSINAKEVSSNKVGYEFSAFSYSSPYEAMATLTEKIRHNLSFRNMDPNRFPHLLTKKCVGRVADRGVVVDGKFVSWEEFTNMFQSHEGFEFEVNFENA